MLKVNRCCLNGGLLAEPTPQSRPTKRLAAEIYLKMTCSIVINWTKLKSSNVFWNPRFFEFKNDLARHICLFHSSFSIMKTDTFKTRKKIQITLTRRKMCIWSPPVFQKISWFKWFLVSHNVIPLVLFSMFDHPSLRGHNFKISKLKTLPATKQHHTLFKPPKGATFAAIANGTAIWPALRTVPGGTVAHEKSASSEHTSTPRPLKINENPSLHSRKMKYFSIHPPST